VTRAEVARESWRPRYLSFVKTSSNRAGPVGTAAAWQSDPEERLRDGLAGEVDEHERNGSKPEDGPDRSEGERAHPTLRRFPSACWRGGAEGCGRCRRVKQSLATSVGDPACPLRSISGLAQLRSRQLRHVLESQSRRNNAKAQGLDIPDALLALLQRQRARYRTRQERQLH